MRHLVLGHNGNLGHDLINALRAKGHTVLQSIDNIRYPSKGLLLQTIIQLKPEVIWNCIGAGSVDGNFHDQLLAHVNLPVQLHETFPNAIIINFSTSFVANKYNTQDPFDQQLPNQSLYALSKSTMENYIKFLNNPNVKAIRVTNLYGAHRPEKCFPGKIKAGNIDSLPINEVTPTPTDELALKLVQHMNDLFSRKDVILNASPTGSCTVAAWGRLINPSIKDGGFSPCRPLSCELGSFFPWSNWETLWDEFNKRHKGLFIK